jgi:hypothetical protein
VKRLVTVLGVGPLDKEKLRSMLYDGTMDRVLRSNGFHLYRVSIDLSHWLKPEFVFTTPMVSDADANTVLFGGTSTETLLGFVEWINEERIALRDDEGRPMSLGLGTHAGSGWFTTMVRQGHSEDGEYAAQIASDGALASRLQEAELNEVRPPLSCPVHARLPPHWLNQACMYACIHVCTRTYARTCVYALIYAGAGPRASARCGR